MAVIFTSLEYSFDETVNGLEDNTYQHYLKQGLEFDLSPRNGNKMAFDNYLVAPNSVLRVVEEARDAQVPDFSDPPSIMDLSAPVVPSQVLDTPAIIDSIVDELPFRFTSGAVADPTPPHTEMHPDLVNQMFGFEATETFQDLTQLIDDPPMPSMSCSPGPLTSPTDSIFSDITQSSSTSLLSAASTSSETLFFAPDFEVLSSSGGSTVKSERLVIKRDCSGERYSQMRVRNNMASRRSRQTRRDRERDMEKQLGSLLDENVSLKSKVRSLEELVEKTKKIIIQAVAKR